MSNEQGKSSVDAVANEMFGLLGTGRQVPPYTARDPGFGLAQAYAVASRVRDMRMARGQRPVGRKIGFTNRTVWDGAGITGPIWNYMYHDTVHDLARFPGAFPLTGWPEPRIEPEIVLHFARAPDRSMSDAELLACIDWVAPGFEIVHSPYPGWALKAADAVAAFGVHTALFIGETRAIAEDREDWGKRLDAFTCELKSSQGIIRTGHARNVLGGPLHAVRAFLEEIARYPGSEPLAAGEIVTTGTLTEAMPIERGQTWASVLDGIGLPGLKLTFA